MGGLDGAFDAASVLGRLFHPPAYALQGTLEQVPPDPPPPTPPIGSLNPPSPSQSPTPQSAHHQMIHILIHSQDLD